MPAEDVPTALIDGETGLVVYAPDPRTWPDMQRLGNPLRKVDQQLSWVGVPSGETLKTQPTASYGGARQDADPDPIPSPSPSPELGPGPALQATPRPAAAAATRDVAVAVTVAVAVRRK